MKYTLSDVVAYKDFDIALGTFLDAFRRRENAVRILMIAERPHAENANKLTMCLAAAIAHKLANDAGITPPDWVHDPALSMPFPIYAHDITNPEYQQFLRETSPIEYASRNLFYGAVLERV